MDFQRGRSPSTGHQLSHSDLRLSPSPRPFKQESANIQGLELGIETSFETNGNHLDQSYMSSSSFVSINGHAPFVDNGHQFINQSTFSQPGVTHDFSQQQSPYARSQGSFNEELIDPNPSPNFQGVFALLSDPSGQDQYDPSFVNEQLPAQLANESINPAQLDMASSHHHNQTPSTPSIKPDSSSLHQSPSFNHTPFHSSPGHSRNASLGPESAQISFGASSINHAEWNVMRPQFQSHRRTPSEYSDVSASSAQHSPNLVQHDLFDGIDQHYSPRLHSQDASIYQDVLGIGSFSLSDPQIQHVSSPRQGLSPAHSPAISPRLVPQQSPNMNQQNHFITGIPIGFTHDPVNIFAEKPFPQLNHDMGQTQQMVPDINVEFAPASRQNSFDPSRPASLDQDALTPPERGRRRAFTDTTNTNSTLISRRRTPSSSSIQPESSLAPRSPDANGSLYPTGRSDSNSPNRLRRQSTPSMPNRDYILALADPDHQVSVPDNVNTKRAQKHPANFQCDRCPKRFTRAYNLRSHRRTHTDERPFVCTVCGKAFARQHDRKRHEGLHSGEKKFVCKGGLKQGGQWGCSRRFARADALGRHFRSEAGRICIKPLLDEEAIERQQAQHMQNMHNMQSPSIVVGANGFPIDANGNYTLPAALLAQYPALANMPLHGDGSLDDDASLRSSFDASGSEYYDEGDDCDHILNGPGPPHYSQQSHMNDSFTSFNNDIGIK